MDICWKDTAGRDAGEHRRSPWVAPKEPIAMIDHRVMILPVAGHQLVQVDLCDECNDKIIRAPEERNTDAVRIQFRAFHDLFDTAAIISCELAFRFRIDQRIQSEM